MSIRHGLLILALCICTSVPAQDKKKPEKKVEPKILLIVPLAATPGQTTKLTLRGLGLDQAKEVKVADGRGSAKVLNKSKSAPPDKLPADRYGDTQVEIELKLGDKLPPGPVMLTVVTPDGETPPRGVLVEGSTQVVKDKEGNDGFRQAQEIKLPVVIDGRIERQRDVDVFRFEGKAGQKVRAEVFAARHGSALDPLLTLYGASGIQVAVAESLPKAIDTKLEAVLPADGVYYLSLIDAHDTGGSLHVYRLDVR